MLPKSVETDWIVKIGFCEPSYQVSYAEKVMVPIYSLRLSVILANCTQLIEWWAAVVNVTVRNAIGCQYLSAAKTTIKHARKGNVCKAFIRRQFLHTFANFLQLINIFFTMTNTYSFLLIINLTIITNYEIP